MKAWTAVLALAVLGDAAAARIESLTVGHAGGHFTIAAVFELEASPAAVRAVITDYAHLERLSPSILESRVVGRTADGPLVFTRSRACAAWFCRELRKTELVTDRGEELVALAVPGDAALRGNVTHSVSRWRITPAGAGTRIEMRSEVDPEFFVPPLVGPPLMKKAMRRETEALARGIERAAQAAAGPPPPAPGHG